MTFLVLLLLAGVVVKGGAEMLCEPDAYGEPPASSTARPRLRRDLLCQYDRGISPEKVMNISVEVFVRRARVVHRTIEVDVLASLRWDDRFLTWDPVQYDGVDQLHISSNDIWSPPIESITTLPWLSVETRTQTRFWPVLCSVSSNGSVACPTATVLGGTCLISSFYWPHMLADCAAFIGTDTRVHKNVGVVSANQPRQQAELSYYVPGNSWIITSWEREQVQIGVDLYALVFRVKIHSRGINISSSLTGPAVVLSLMLLGSFILPVTALTRLGLCCCSFFGAVLVSSLLFEYLEPYQDPTPLVVTFYSGLLSLSTIATFMVLLINIVVPTSTKPLKAPRWVYSFQNWLHHSEAGKLWMKVLALTPSGQNYCQAIELMPALHMQRGAIPGAVSSTSEDHQDPSDGDRVPPVQLTNAQCHLGPHRIWEFIASFLNRCLCIIFLVAFGTLGLYLSHAITIYEDPQFADW